jgi:hypothetical protein
MEAFLKPAKLSAAKSCSFLVLAEADNRRCHGVLTTALLLLQQKEAAASVMH